MTLDFIEQDKSDVENRLKAGKDKKWADQLGVFCGEARKKW